MNPFAIVVAVLIGLFVDWGDALFFVGGYLFAFVLISAAARMR